MQSAARRQSQRRDSACDRSSRSRKHNRRTDVATDIPRPPAGVYTDRMQLHTARLCLDCQEVHDGQTCPVCGSESFAYISRWIPAPERRAKPRPTVEPPAAETYRRLLSPERNRQGTSSWLKRGAFGLAAVSAAAWML